MNEQEYFWYVTRFPELRPYLRRVEGSHRNIMYFRAKRKDSVDPSLPQLQARLAFAKAAFDSYGKRGFTFVNNVLMPGACKDVQKAMKGQRYAKFSVREKRVQETVLKARILQEKIEGRKKTVREAIKTLVGAMKEIIEHGQTLKDSS